MGLAIAMAIFVASWQLLFHGYMPARNRKTLQATRFHGRGTPIFMRCFWRVPNGGIVALYLMVR